MKKKLMTTWAHRCWFPKDDIFKNVRLMLWDDGTVTWEEPTKKAGER